MWIEDVDRKKYDVDRGIQIQLNKHFFTYYNLTLLLISHFTILEILFLLP